MQIRELTTSEEFERVSAVESTVWDVSPLDAVSPHFLRATAAAGGVSLGAIEGEVMVGMAMAFPGFCDGKVFLWSHMTGVLPTYQGRDIGFQLKLAQRTWALEHGIDQIRWTFDPFLRGNANFNLHRLKASARRYHVNFYGAMTDGLNRGLPSDRLEACWDLLDAQVVAVAAGVNGPEHAPAFVPNQAVLLADPTNRPISLDRSSAAPVLVEIPHAVRSLAPDLQLTWRQAVREAMAPRFEQGWYAAAFHSTPHHAWYVLERI